MEFTFNIAGKEKLTSMLTRLNYVVKDFRPAWETITEDLENETQEIFASEGSKGSHGKWKPLSKKYADWKKKNYPGKSILVLRGDLQASLMKGGKDNISKIRKNDMQFGTKLKVGRYNLGYLHQKGTKRLYVRRIFDFTVQFISRIKMTLRNYISYSGK